MSDQQDRKLQHTDEQKPVSEKKSGNQQKQENPSGQPKSPRSEQEKHDQREEKTGLGVRTLIAIEPSSLNKRRSRL